MIVGRVLAAAPLGAAVFALPQFAPQILRVRRSGRTAGVSWSWAALTSVNNSAWGGYFVLAGFWTAFVASCVVTLMSGTLAVMLARRIPVTARAQLLVAFWAVLLAAFGCVLGRSGLGGALTAAFVVQVAPSLWSAYTTPDPIGVSGGTWLLILGELACFGLYGLHVGDPRLIALGTVGVSASVAMLARSLGAKGSKPARR